MLHGEIGLAESLLESGLEVADLREGEVSLPDLWLLCRNDHSDVPFVHDFRLHG